MDLKTVQHFCGYFLQNVWFCKYKHILVYSAGFLLVHSPVLTNKSIIHLVLVFITHLCPAASPGPSRHSFLQQQDGGRERSKEIWNTANDRKGEMIIHTGCTKVCERDKEGESNWLRLPSASIRRRQQPQAVKLSNYLEQMKPAGLDLEPLKWLLLLFTVVCYWVYIQCGGVTQGSSAHHIYIHHDESPITFTAQQIINDTWPIVSSRATVGEH